MAHPVFNLFYECVTSPVTRREETKLRTSENRFPRTAFRLERADVVGGCRKYYYEELHSLYEVSGGRPMCRRKDIKINFKGIRYKGAFWYKLT
jgi:hypothetical protein